MMHEVIGPKLPTLDTAALNAKWKAAQAARYVHSITTSHLSINEQLFMRKIGRAHV